MNDNCYFSCFSTGIYTLNYISTVLAKSSTDKNRAFGMSLLTVGWAMGMIIGPAVSGVLADPWPVSQYNLRDNLK